MGIVELTYRGPRAQYLLASVDSVGTGLVHLCLLGRNGAGNDVVHHAGMVVAISSGRLEHHLVLLSHGFIPGVIADRTKPPHPSPSANDWQLGRRHLR